LSHRHHTTATSLRCPLVLSMCGYDGNCHHMHYQFDTHACCDNYHILQIQPSVTYVLHLSLSGLVLCNCGWCFRHSVPHACMHFPEPWPLCAQFGSQTLCCHPFQVSTVTPMYRLYHGSDSTKLGESDSYALLSLVDYCALSVSQRLSNV
jgi:hypothetical protein